MAIRDWIDLEFLKLISWHTSAVLCVLVSVVVLSIAVKWAVGPGWLRTYVEGSERAVLVVIFVYFPFQVAYDLYKEFRNSDRKK
jgi:hypothetical protein